MPESCCTATKASGDPCTARPLPGKSVCLFHDPDHQAALAQGRSKGGATPRRRLRRFPRLLDHMHVGELLSELFIDALNDPDRIDTKRLQALNQLARTLLKAVGTPPTFLVHRDRRDPPASVGHLLRVYPPLAPEVEALLEAEPPPDPEAHWPDPDRLDPESVPAEYRNLDLSDLETWEEWATFLPPKEDPEPDASTPASAEDEPTPEDATAAPSQPATQQDLIAASQEPPSPPRAPQEPLSEWEEAAEQAVNRSQTGLPPTEQTEEPRDRQPANPASQPANAAPLSSTASSTLHTAPDPTRDSLPSSVSPCLRGDPLPDTRPVFRPVFRVLRRRVDFGPFG
jgi:hypothetical protein